MNNLDRLKNIKSFLVQRIKNMQMFINEPNLATKEDFGYCALPLIRIGIMNTQEEIQVLSNISNLLGEFNDCEKKIFMIRDALELMGKGVVKHSKKPFQSGRTVNTVCGIIVHPFKPGYNLAYTFVEDDSCVWVKQVKEFHG